MTKNMLRILEAIEDHWAIRGYAPSYRELATSTGLKSASSVAEIVRRLEDDGLVTYKKDRKRTIKSLRNQSQPR
jgi:SOS-response transcriptional repressor LexA